MSQKVKVRPIRKRVRKVDSKGRISIPAPYLLALGIRNKDRIEVTCDESALYIKKTEKCVRSMDLQGRFFLSSQLMDKFNVAVGDAFKVNKCNDTIILTREKEQEESF